MTFDELFGDYRVTDKERTELVWFLAQRRMRKTLEALLPQKVTK